MAVTRIKNNQITDSTITYQKIASGTLVGSLFNSNLSLNSNVTITGNLTVSGNTTTVNSIDTTVNDPLIVFNSGYVGTPAYDVGFLVDRSLGSLENYGGVNAALIWSESDGAFITVLTTETGATKGAVSKNFKANLVTGNLTVSNVATIQTARITTLQSSGTYTATGNVVAASGVNATNYTTGALVVPGGGGVGITGDLWVQGPSNFAGNMSAGNILLSGNINVPVGGVTTTLGVFYGNAGGINALYAGAPGYTTLDHTVLQMTGNIDNYVQVNFQNINSGNFASTDFVATADNGTDDYGYINLGINSSTFADAGYPGFFPNDGYLIHHGAPAVGGNLIILSELANSTIKLMVGDYDAANVKATVTNSGFRVNTSTASTSTTSGALIVGGGAGIAGAVYAGSIQNTPIGTTTASTGYFSTLNATNASSSNIVIGGGYISALTNAYITTGVTTNFSTANARINGGNVNIATGTDTSFVTADNVEGFSAKFGNLLVENGASFPNIFVTGGTIANVTNFSTSFGNIYNGYADSFVIGANTAAPASFTTANTSGVFKVTDTTESTSSTTGAAIVSGGLGVAKNIYAGGNVVIDGNLTVRGTTTNIDSVDLVVQDSTIRLHTFANSAPLASNDGRDIGIIGEYYLGADKNFFFGRKNTSGYFEYYADVTENGSNVVSGTYGTVKSGELVISNTTSATNTISGAITVAGGVGVAGNLWAGTIYAGSINSTPIGNASASTGAFTTITATSTLTVAGASTLNSLLVNNEAKAATINGTANVYLAPQSGSATVTINPLVIGAIDNMSIGATTAANAYVSNFRAATSLFAAPTGTVWLRGGTGTSGINNIPIGAVTPSAGTFTTAESQTLNVTNGNVTTLVATNLSSANVTVSGPVIATGNIVAAATTSSTNTTTGALVVKGGAGIAGAVNIGTSLSVDGGTYGNVVTTQFGSLFATSYGPNNYSLIQAWSQATQGMGLNAYGTQLYSSGTINFRTGATVRDKDYPTGGTTGVQIASNGAVIASTGIASTTTSTGAVIVTGGIGATGNLNLGGNLVITGTVNSPGNIIVNSEKSAATDFTVRGANENSLLFVHSNSTYDQVVVGGNIATANVTLGAKLQVTSQDSLLVPVGPSSERPSAKGYTDVDGMLRYNSTTNGLEYYGNGAWNNTGSVLTVITSRTFSNSSGDIGGNVDGSNTTFTLNANATSSGTLVTINGVMQIPLTAYSISGSTLEFTEPPAVGDIIDTRILATTSTISYLASDSGFNQFVANNTSLSFYTGNVLVGSVENWRIDNNGDLYPVTSSNIGGPNYRVDYLFASNIDIQGGAISGVSLGGGSLDNTVIGGNIAATGTFTTLYASTLLQTNAAIASDDLTGLFVAPGSTDKISSFDKSVYRSGKFFVQLSDESGTEYQAAEVLVVHNGTTPSIEVYGVTFTGAANLATFSSNIAGSVVNLNASSAGANLRAKVTPTLMRI